METVPTTIPGNICTVTVGHVPREMSRHVWYAIQEGAEVSGTVKSLSPKLSPLKQGGLEIMITMTVKLKKSKAMEVFKTHVEKVAYPENSEYVDDLLQILKGIMDDNQASESEDSESDVELVEENAC